MASSLPDPEEAHRVLMVNLGPNPRAAQLLREFFYNPEYPRHKETDELILWIAGLLIEIEKVIHK